jgi:tetratricopeptide (TPR) repeat protein
MAIHLPIERLRALPSKPDDTWQGGLLQIPSGPVEDDAGRRFEPTACIWVSAGTGRVHLSEIGPPATITPAVVVATMVAFATNAALAGYRPGRLEVADDAHAAALRAVVGPLGITVAVVDRLAGVEFMAGELGRSLPGMGMGSEPEGLGDDPAITPERLAGFAGAAAAFFEARPWEHFGPTDLVRVAAPNVARPLRFFNVMGGGGEQFGLAFFPSVAAFGKMIDAAEPGEYAARHPMVSVTFDVAKMLPRRDVADWKAYGLPTAKRGRKVLYPFPVTFNRGVWVRPTAAELETMEGLMSALAAVRPADLAAGKWSATVSSAGAGAVRYELELLDMATPSLHFDPFAALAGVGGAAGTEAERLVDQARQAGGRRGAELARRALAADPDSVDAYVILGETAPNAAAAIDFYRQGITAGERTLGPAFFKENGGHFWMILETRPYMRAQGGLANALRATGRLDEAVIVWQRMLELNPNDNQGVRDLLAAALLQQGRDAELSELLGRYPDDDGVVHRYAEALVQFRAEGDAPAAVERLRGAIEANPHVVPYLTGQQRLPGKRPATYSPGQPTEAQAFVADLLPGWRATPGAIEWLGRHAPAQAAAQPRAKAKVKPKAKAKPKRRSGGGGMWLPPGSNPPRGL